MMMEAHIPAPEPPDSERDRRRRPPRSDPTVPGEIPPAPPEAPPPIDEPRPPPAVKDPPPDETPNPKRY